MSRKRRKKRKQKLRLRFWVVVLGVVLFAGVGAWLSTQDPEEREDSVVWLRDVVRWGQSGFKGPIPQRPLRVDYGGFLDEYFFAGAPQPVDGLRMLPRTGFIVAYDEGRRNPAWVAYRLAPEARYVPEDRPRFEVDWQTRSRVAHGDYTGSGYDRGHMAPNYAIATRYGREAQVETFLMSNIVPQAPDLNQGPWREIEEWLVNNYAARFDMVYVITGPIYDEKIERLRSGVEIPDAFFKVAVGLRKGSMEAVAFVAGQEVERGARINGFRVSVDDVEEGAGFDFFAGLPDEEEEALER